MDDFIKVNLTPLKKSITERLEDSEINFNTTMRGPDSDVVSVQFGFLGGVVIINYGDCSNVLNKILGNWI